MRVEIIGGGAIGLLIASKLASCGAETALWTRSSEQSEDLRRSGIGLQDFGAANGNLVKRERVESAPFEEGGYRLPEIMPEFCWLIVAVKQSHLDATFIHQLARRAALFDGKAAVICIQNGIGHLEKLSAKLADVPLYAAVTTEGAKRIDSITVQHTGKGRTWIAKVEAKGAIPDKMLDFAQKKCIEIFQKAGFDALLSNDINNRILHKLLINAVINPLTAIFQVLNGELPEQPNRLLLMMRLYEETHAILCRAGMKASEDDWERVLQVCRQTSGNASSMLSDIRAGKLTEIDSINGAIADLAEGFGIEARINRALTDIIHAIEQK